MTPLTPQMRTLLAAAAGKRRGVKVDGGRLVTAAALERHGLGRLKRHEEGGRFVASRAGRARLAAPATPSQAAALALIRRRPPLIKSLCAEAQPGDSYSLADGTPVNPVVARNLIAAGRLVACGDGLLPDAAQTYRAVS